MNTEYYKLLIDRVRLKPLDKELPSNKKQKMSCLLCGEIISVIPKGKVANFKKHGIPGCKSCTDHHQHRLARRHNIELVKDTFIILDEITEDQFIPKETKVKVKNKKCGHVFSARWDNLKNQLTNCPTCNVKEKIKRCKENSKKMHLNSLKGKTEFEVYKARVYSATRKSYKTNKSIINPKGLQRVLAGRNGHHLDHKISIKNCFLWGVPPEVCGGVENLEIVKWRDNVSKKSRSTLCIPQTIMPYVGEISRVFYDEMDDYLAHLKHDSIIKKHTKIDHYMISYMIDETFAIVFLPFKMFYQQSLDSTTYLSKFKKFLSSKGIQSYFIYEDEWILKKDIVKSKIKYLLGLVDERIYARKCNIKEIDNVTKNTFLNENHLQGTCRAEISLGAYYEEILVSVMTFSLPRSQMGDKNKVEGWYELSRFCTKRDTVVTGVASRMLQYFISRYVPQNIFSFSDLRWSEGGLYEVLGFKKSSIVKPDYKYVVDGRRKHRWGFRKTMIRERFPEVWDNSSTEYQMMLKKGIDRVWDCGYIKYEYNMENPE